VHKHTQNVINNDLQQMLMREMNMLRQV